MRTAWGNANDQGANIEDAKFGVFIIKSLPRTAEWAVLAGTLMSIATSAEIMHRITTHVDFITPAAPPMRAVQALATQTNARPARNPDLNRGPRTENVDTLAANATVVAMNSTDRLQSIAFSATTHTTPPTADKRVTYADSAASRHFFTQREDFITYGPVPGDIAAGSVANGGVFRVEGMGMIQKLIKLDGREIELTLDSVLHAPRLKHNLISIGCLDLKGCITTFGGGIATFYEPSGTPFMRGTRHNHTMYKIDFMEPTGYPDGLSAMSARSNEKPTS
ncbi:hypothetical protein C0991_009334, partial [Blastosporella zonata]